MKFLAGISGITGFKLDNTIIEPVNYITYIDYPVKTWMNEKYSMLKNNNDIMSGTPMATIPDDINDVSNKLATVGFLSTKVKEDYLVSDTSNIELNLWTTFEFPDTTSCYLYIYPNAIFYEYLTIISSNINNDQEKQLTLNDLRKIETTKQKEIRIYSNNKFSGKIKFLRPKYNIILGYDINNYANLILENKGNITDIEIPRTYTTSDGEIKTCKGVNFGRATISYNVQSVKCYTNENYHIFLTSFNTGDSNKPLKVYIDKPENITHINFIYSSIAFYDFNGNLLKLYKETPPYTDFPCLASFAGDLDNWYDYYKNNNKKFEIPSGLYGLNFSSTSFVEITNNSGNTNFTEDIYGNLLFFYKWRKCTENDERLSGKIDTHTGEIKKYYESTDFKKVVQNYDDSKLSTYYEPMYQLLRVNPPYPYKDLTQQDVPLILKHQKWRNLYIPQGILDYPTGIILDNVIFSQNIKIDYDNANTAGVKMRNIIFDKYCNLTGTDTRNFKK